MQEGPGRKEAAGRCPTPIDTSRRRWGQPHLLPTRSPVWGAATHPSRRATRIHRGAAPRTASHSRVWRFRLVTHDDAGLPAGERAESKETGIPGLSHAQCTWTTLRPRQPCPTPAVGFARFVMPNAPTSTRRPPHVPFDESRTGSSPERCGDPDGAVVRHEGGAAAAGGDQFNGPGRSGLSTPRVQQLPRRRSGERAAPGRSAAGKPDDG